MKFVLIIIFQLILFNGSVWSTGIFKVRHKFQGRRGLSAAEMRSHDVIRHRRILAADLPIGGRGIPTDTGLYYTEIGLGTPSKKFHVQVDTGSDILWVNGASCEHCPKTSDLGIKLAFYDLKASGTGKMVSCSEEFCSSLYGDVPGCSKNLPCQYSVTYGDGSSSVGFFVTDDLQYNQVSGNDKTKSVNASITFGCAAEQSGDLGSSSQALDGILGFGQSNSSMISQLALSGKVKKIFSHCLDTNKGGGIFAIGKVVQPKVKNTPLIPNMPHYNVILKAIEVGGGFLQLPTDLFETDGKRGTIIDSGTTLSYLPEVAFKPLINAIFSYQPGLSFHTDQDFLCFKFTESIDDGFPEVVFHFENSLVLNVYPRDYLFENGDNIYCVGWQSGGTQSKDGKDMVLLGDLVLSNKLVVYDLENQVIGWTEYNCSSSIKIQDDITKAIYSVDAHNISPGIRLRLELAITTLLTMIWYLFS